MIFRVTEKILSIEFFNNIKGIIPSREAAYVSSTGCVYLLIFYFRDGPTRSLEGIFNIGQVIKVRIIDKKEDSKLVIASIVKVTENFTPPGDMDQLKVGQIVDGVVTDIHSDNAVLKVQPSQIKGLVSLVNLANHRDTTVPQLRTSLHVGDTLQGLVVVSKNVEKGLVIVASKPRAKARLPDTEGPIKYDSLQVGQRIPGVVIKQTRRGSTIRLAKRVFGNLHPTDVSDDYDMGVVFPAVDTVVSAVVLSVDVSSQQVSLSSRQSRLEKGNQEVVDKEIISLSDIKVGDSIRGFVKSIADHGLFVSISRTLDARVQIKELFDEVST